MSNCNKCGKKLGFLDNGIEYKLSNGKTVLYCKACDKKEEQVKDELEYENKLKNALKKNSKWEYKIIQFDTKVSSLVATGAKIPFEEDLCKFGLEGWELISAVGLQALARGIGMSSSGTTTNIAFIFKRKL